MASRSVILLDFDNIFFGVWQQDASLALDFAYKPMDWLPRLSQSYLAAAEPRRWLVARCYLNPDGSVPNPSKVDERIFFRRFRPGLISAGFEVIDCPTMTRGGKNAADIRIVIDALDLLYHRCDFEEFVVASGDSDFTPLLQRLRADNRVITVMSPGITAPAYSSLADKLVDFEAIEALVRPPREMTGEPIPFAAIDEDTVAREAFGSFIRTHYAEASAPLSLPSLAHAAAQTVPEAVASGWFGNGFTVAIQRLELPNAHIEGNFLWDEERHQPPETGQKQASLDLPEAVETLVRLLDLPRLHQEAWTPVFNTLARYAAEHEFNLTEATKWSRDQLANSETPVGRPAIGYVVKGTQFGGAPLNNEPAPTGEEIARAFHKSLIDRAYQAGLVFDEAELSEIADWFGLGSDQAVDGAFRDDN